jgi:DNA polymerase-3 subunit alpha
MATRFIHLRVHSDYSLGYGVAKVADLANFAAKMKMPALALSDNYNLFASLEFSMACVKKGVQPIIASIMRIACDPEQPEQLAEILLIAKNRQGYLNLLKLSSKSYLESKPEMPPYLQLQDLRQHADGIIALCGSRQSPTAYFLKDNKIEQAKAITLELAEMFEDNFYLELIRRNDAVEEALEPLLLGMAEEHNIPVVATNDVCFLEASMLKAQDVSICIAASTIVDDDNRIHANPECYFKTAKEMAAAFADIPEAIENSVKIAKRCSVMSETSDPRLPSFAEDEAEELEKQAQEGLQRRIAHISGEEAREQYHKRLRYELDIIKNMKFSGYFLIVSDFIKWSKASGIPVGPGRGSGAGSLVAWSLEITDLDPLHYGLLFERFLNPERISMPDFDIDFCQEKREKVIEYVQAKYGIERVAHIITFGKLQARAVLRDVARALDYKGIDRICKMIPNNPAKPVTLQQAIDLDRELRSIIAKDNELKKVVEISLQLEGNNRHVSTHAAGVVIADRPIEELVPLYKDVNSHIPVLQYSMKYAEAAGLVKFDFLGLKTLTVISWACNLIKKERGIDIDFTQVDIKDPASYQMLAQGKTVGVFQFESSGMREAIKKLKPDSIEDLIALASLYRPGPMDNIPSYINRKHGLEEPDYIHPLLEPILKETYGIIIYQEQVMQIAQTLSGYTLGAADSLRKAMGKKIASEMEAHRNIFIEGAVKNGVAAAKAREIFDLVAKFASYGFNKSHAAAYAYIAFQTAYLKANYTLEFITASMNLEIDDTDKLNLFCQDAKALGIEVLPPDINKSAAYFTVEGDKIRFGLAGLKNVGVAIVEQMMQVRSQGEFTDLFDFIERCNRSSMNKRMLESLVMSGAMDCLHDNRRQLFENIETLIRHSNQHHEQQASSQASLFGGDESISSRPELAEVKDWGKRERLRAEYLAQGFYLKGHPIEEYQARLKKMGVLDSDKIAAVAGEKMSKHSVAGVIISKKIRSSARGKYAFLQMSDLQGMFEISIFNEAMLSNDFLEVGECVFARVDVKREESGLRVMVNSIKPIEEACNGINTHYHITVANEHHLDYLQEYINEVGVAFRLKVKTPDGNAILKMPQNLRLLPEVKEHAPHDLIIYEN